MTHQVYKDMLAVMKKRGGVFSGMDIPEFYAMVEALFTPEEAELNNVMPRGPFTAADMAKIRGKAETEVHKTLEAMAAKGLCMALKVGGTDYYQSARLAPGIMEFQFMPGKTTEREKRLARLIYDYKQAYYRENPPKAKEFPTTRVITVDRTIAPNNQIHTYDQVKSFIDANEFISVSTCYCRHAAALRGEDTHGVPNDVCMQFGLPAQYAVERLGARMVTKKEAIEVLERSEEAGLIHMSDNVASGISFICNCDRWHCIVVNYALRKPKPGLFFNSGFQPITDPAMCTACEECIDRCPSEARSMSANGGPPKVDLDRCFGCAVCATGCPSNAIEMVNRPGFPDPPQNTKALKEAIKTAV